MHNFKDSYHKGEAGEPRDRKGVIARVGHRLGRVARSDREMARLETPEAPGERERVFQTAMTRARGANKVALQIIQTSEQIPHQAHSKPTNGVDVPDPHTGKRLGRQWTARLAHSPETEDKIPFTPVSLSFSHIKADSTEWSSNALNIPVKTVEVVCNQPLDDNDQPEGAPTTTVAINSLPSNPADKDTWERPLGSGLRFTIDAVGRVEKVYLTEDGNPNYAEYNPSVLQTNPEELLSSVLASVEDTAQAYRQLDQAD